MAEVNQQALEIVVDDGGQRVPIRSTSGEEIGVFIFHPTDLGIIQRYNETMAKFSEILAPLEAVSIAPDGTAADKDDDDALEAIREAEGKLYAACDYIFGGNMSEAFFGKMHPFSPVHGVFYCETALAAVGNFISAQFERETAQISKRLDKYVGKYRPQK